MDFQPLQRNQSSLEILRLVNPLQSMCLSFAITQKCSTALKSILYLLLYPQVREEMAEQDLDAERKTFKKEQASEDVAIDNALMLERWMCPGGPPPEAKDKDLLQSTGPDRDVTPVSAAMEVHVSSLSSC